MDLLTQYLVSQNTQFVSLVQQAIVNQALAVRQEAENVDMHAARMILSTKVLQDPNGMARLLASGVISISTLNEKITYTPEVTGVNYTPSSIGGTKTDADITSAVESVWNSYCIF